MRALPARRLPSMPAFAAQHPALVCAVLLTMSNLFMSIAAKEGIELDKFGDSTGMLEI